MNPEVLLSVLTLLAALAAPVVAWAQTEGKEGAKAAPVVTQFEKFDHGSLVTPTDNNATSRTQVVSTAQAAVGMDETLLGEKVPMTLPLTTASGEVVTLQGISNGKPIVLQLGYYRCPVVCSYVLGNLGACVNEIGQDLQPGRDFEIVSLSIDPKENQAAAAASKAKTLAQVKPEFAKAGWHFTVANEAVIKEMASACGFNYRYIPSVDQYAHPGVLVMLSPEGKVTQFLKASGADLTADGLRQAVKGAAAGTVTLHASQDIFSVCISNFVNIFPRTAMQIMKVGGVLLLLLLVPAFFWLRRFEKRRQAAQSGA